MMQQAEQENTAVQSVSSGLESRSRFCGVRDFFDLVDNWVTTSRFGQVFHLAGTGHVSLGVTRPPFNSLFLTYVIA